MNRLLKFVVLLTSVAILSACGSSTTQSGTVPTPVDPTVPTPTPVVTEDTTQNPNIPDLATSVRLVLTDAVNFTGLQEIAAPDIIDTASIVGNIKFQMAFSGGRSSTVSKANTLIAVEDSMGLWWMRQQLFPGTGLRTSTSFSAIFADDYLVTRVQASVSGNTMTGTVYYRVRQSGENECKGIQYCNWYGQCNTVYDANACYAYMDTNNSFFVKSLGTFSSSYSSWATLPEGQ